MTAGMTTRRPVLALASGLLAGRAAGAAAALAV